MEAFLVFDPSNYPVLTKCNKQFLRTVTTVAHRNGLLESSTDSTSCHLGDNGEEFNNILVLLFTPFVASVRILKNKSPTYNMFSDINKNAKINYVEHFDHFFVHVSDVTTIRELRKVERRLRFFKELTAFLFGSNPQCAKSDPNQTFLLKLLFERWSSSSRSPVYMLEAIERLHISSSMQKMFNRLLQCVLGTNRDQMKLYGEMPFHAFFFLNQKLLSQHSAANAHKIARKNFLQLNLLVETVCNEDLSAGGDFVEVDSDISDSDDDESQLIGEANEYYGDNDDSDREDKCASSPASSHRTTMSSSMYGSKKRLFSTPSSPITSEDKLPFQSHLIYLKASETSDLLMPYCARVVRISSSLSLLLLSELNSVDFACAIHVVLETLNCVQYNKCDLNGFISLHRFERAFAKLKRYLNDSSCKNVLRSIDKLMASDFKRSLLTLETCDLPSMVEALCSSICSSLREIYHSHVYVKENRRLQAKHQDKDIIAHLDSIRIYCEQRSKDYLEYLEVKSERNMTVDPYLDIAPGLVAFFYTDRVRNEVVYAISDDADKIASGDCHIARSNLLRNVLPEAIELAYTSLSSGNLSSKWSIPEKHLTFNYYMWFEDMAGRQLVPNVSDFTLQYYPSMVSSNFIQEIISKCFTDDILKSEQRAIACYELLFIEKQNESEPSDCLMQAKRLAARLWEVTSTASISSDETWAAC